MSVICISSFMFHPRSKPGRFRWNKPDAADVTLDCATRFGQAPLGQHQGVASIIRTPNLPVKRVTTGSVAFRRHHFEVSHILRLFVASIYLFFHTYSHPTSSLSSSLTSFFPSSCLVHCRICHRRSAAVPPLPPCPPALDRSLFRLIFQAGPSPSLIFPDAS